MKKHSKTEKKILILYHSGSGSTKMIAETINCRLVQKTETALFSVNKFSEFELISGYDLLVIAFPTYHCHPSESVLAFIKKIPTQSAVKKAYILTTCALFRGNSIRILSQKLRKKNIITVGHASIRGPASDGALMSPVYLRFVYRYQQNITEKIKNISENIMNSLKNKTRQNIPAFSWYAPLNAPNKYFGMRYSHYLAHKIHILTDYCINCQTCIHTCERGCYTAGGTIPRFNPQNCEFCLRCLHHCAQKAITFTRKQNNNKRLDMQFYRSVRERIEKSGNRMGRR